jgi:carbamoyl-phosphate synthase large subunit
LIDIIRKEEIDYLIALTDPEVDTLSAHRRAFEPHRATLCIPSASALSVCRDKLALYECFKDSAHIYVIPTFEAAHLDSASCTFPLIAKPRNGRSSEGLLMVDTEEELRVRRSQLRDHVVQPFFSGDIFTVDVVRDDARDKSFAISRKELLRTKNGAGMSVEVSFNETLATATQHVAKQLQINGCVNMEYILSGGRYYLMDINPRFSAGIAFSALAGYDMVRSHLHCFTGEEIQEPITIKTMTIAKKLTEVVTWIDE